MRKFPLTIITVLAGALPAFADTVLVNEDFAGDYTSTIAYFYDGDGLQPHHSIASIFYSNAAEAYMPWWIAKDTDASTDRFMASHSYYETPGRSNDWLICVPVEIPTAGFVLSFDAQSLPIRGLDRLSSLSLYITEEIIDPANLPTTPTHVYENVPYGEDPDMCENDWISYTYPLDDYAGKTIWVNFVNSNNDSDILCLDNVRISRQDVATLQIMDYSEYTDAEEIELTAELTATAAEGLLDWNVSLLADGAEVRSWSGANLACGSTEQLSARIPLVQDQMTQFEFVLTAANNERIVSAGSVTRLSFVPVHRILMEETTSLKCGNCPIAVYNFESMLEDEEIAPYIAPVSVHISAMGFDPMATSAYYSRLPENNVAPLVWIDRDADYTGFNATYDLNYNPSREGTFANNIAKRIAIPAMVDVKAEGQWKIEGNDTTAVVCTATVSPAIDLTGKDYRIAFILTENNVGLDKNPYWIQENYISGMDIEGDGGGWVTLPKKVSNIRFHDVARAISAYDGHPGSLPSDMQSGVAYTFSYELAIPDTYSWSEALNIVMSAAVQRHFCELTAVIIDNETGSVVNCDRIPLDEDATHRFSIRDYIDSGITDVTTDSDNEANAFYYDLLGRPVQGLPSGCGSAAPLLRVTPTGASLVLPRK